MAVQFKIFSLAMKQLSKPLVSSFKNFATSNDMFKKGCIKIGQTMHTLEKGLTGRGRLNIPGAPQILPLSDERALESGAGMLSEFILFSIAGGLLIWENRRNAKSSSDKESTQEKRISEMEIKLNEIIGVVLDQERIIKANNVIRDQI
eukprot:NODE_458_length_8223_cov_0.302683.p6 type:complete len:148 gc:universal NODE_458_length_8223_cov_0.302683:3192-2749(-)